MIQSLVGCFVTLTCRMCRRSWLMMNHVRRALLLRWHREEIHGRNRFPMVAKEGQPALGPVRSSRRPLHPTGDGSLGKIQTEHAQFSVDARRSPGWVLGTHPENQFPNLLRRLFPSTLPPDSGN